MKFHKNRTIFRILSINGLIGMFQFLLEMITGPVRRLFIPINHLLPSCPPFLRVMARGSHYEVLFFFYVNEIGIP